MTSVKLQVSSWNETRQRFLDAAEGEEQGSIISFDSPALLFKTLSGKRWHLLQALTGAGPMSIREAARRVGRDVKAVHTDIQALLNVGILEKTDKGQIVFPFDSIHVDFILQAA